MMLGRLSIGAPLAATRVSAPLMHYPPVSTVDSRSLTARLRSTAVCACPVGRPAARGVTMPKYLFTGSFTAQGAKGIHAEGGTRRAQAIKESFASVGGQLESYYFAFGSDDFFIVADLPDNVTAAALALITSASGAVHTRTVVLLTPEEVDRAAQLSPAYRAPGS
jgi:uncharacterized protein with GYD domain